MRWDCKISDLRGFGEEFIETDGGGTAVEPADGNPGVCGEVEVHEVSVC